MGFIQQYIVQSFGEIRKVSWPSKEKTFQYTLIVSAASIGSALVLGGLDQVFSYLLRVLVL